MFTFEGIAPATINSHVLTRFEGTEPLGGTQLTLCITFVAAALSIGPWGKVKSKLKISAKG